MAGLDTAAKVEEDDLESLSTDCFAAVNTLCHARGVGDYCQLEVPSVSLSSGADLDGIRDVKFDIMLGGTFACVLDTRCGTSMYRYV
eukprot:COSAG05_NODE_224_length_13609_cov_26.220429_18_plen_87_part_00